MGFEISFLLFGGCVKNVSPISSKETARTMGPTWVKLQQVTCVMDSLGCEVIYKCVRYSSVYATIEDIRRHVCRKSFIVT